MKRDFTCHLGMINQLVLNVLILYSVIAHYMMKLFNSVSIPGAGPLCL
jgi:hypothetical protein